MAQIIGNRSTAQAITETRLVRQVDAKIALLEPNEAPLVTLYNKMNKREAVKTPRFEWIEDDYTLRWAQNSGATVANNTGSTTVTVADGTLFVPGDLLVVPKVGTSATAPEVIRVTAVVGNALTVVRDVGAAGVDTIPANAALSLIGNAYEEGATLPKAKTTQPVTYIGYTQIFRTVIDLTNTNIASQQYGASSGDRDRLHNKKMKEHKINLNRALLFGRASESLSGGPTGNPIRTTDGINSRLTTNVTDAGGTLTQKTFESFSRQAFRYGKNAKLLLASPMVKSAINEWGRSFLLVKPSESLYGVQIQEVETAHGKWMLVNDWMLENGVAGQNGFGGIAFSLDMEQFKYRYLSNNGLNRDTHVNMDVVKDGHDGKIDEIITEAGFQIQNEKYHAKLYNVVDYMQ